VSFQLSDIPSVQDRSLLVEVATAGYDHSYSHGSFAIVGRQRLEKEDFCAAEQQLGQLRERSEALLRTVGRDSSQEPSWRKIWGWRMTVPLEFLMRRVIKNQARWRKVPQSIKVEKAPKQLMEAKWSTGWPRSAPPLHLSAFHNGVAFEGLRLSLGCSTVVKVSPNASIAPALALRSLGCRIRNGS
jgi:hypothetical protein